MKSGRPETIDDYLAGVEDPAKRAALERLRAQIGAAAPDAVEGISYGMPSWKLDGPLVSMGAAKAHCALYAMSPAVQDRFEAELSEFSTSPGTVRFTPDAPIPPDLVRRIVEARMAENAAAVAARAARKTAKRSATA
ncbi:MAG: DUF1801 domain-containing protein [Pseudomonadota bacterium]